MKYVVLKRENKPLIISVCFWLLLSYCNQPLQKEADKTSFSDSAVANQQYNGIADITVIDDSTYTHATVETNGRVLNAADKQQIDWLIPEDAEIVIFEESQPETRRFAQAVYNHILTRSPFGIERKSVDKITIDSIPTQRFYINFIGDHRYEVRVFNKYKP